MVSNFSKNPPPYHVTQDDVSTPLQRLEVAKITRHQSVRGRGGVIVAMYETHWTGLSRPSWEREIDLQLSQAHILGYWAGTPDQHRQTNRLYRRMRIGAAQRELSRNNRERFLAPGLRPTRGVVAPLPRHGASQRSPRLVQDYDGLWWLGKINASTTEDRVYLVRILDDPGLIKLPFPPRRYTT